MFLGTNISIEVDDRIPKGEVHFCHSDGRVDKFKIFDEGGLRNETNSS